MIVDNILYFDTYEIPLMSSLIKGLTLLALATILLGAFHSSACSESLDTLAPDGMD